MLNLAKKVESPLLKQLKPVIAISLKWKFDYLAKCLASPFELENDVKYWQGMIQILGELAEGGWFSLSKDKHTREQQLKKQNKPTK